MKMYASKNENRKVVTTVIAAKGRNNRIFTKNKSKNHH